MHLQPSMQILHQHSTGWSMTTPHIHDHYELNLSLSGGNRFFVEKGAIEAKKGMLFFFNNMELHRNLVPDNIDYERYLVIFDKSVADNLSTPALNLLSLFHHRNNPLNNHIQLTEEELSEFISLMDDYIARSKTKGYANTIYETIKLGEILLYLNTIVDKRLKAMDTGAPASHPFTKNDKIIPIVHYINQHYTETIHLDDLSKHFFINKSYLCKQFKQATGYSIHQYITTKRILQSKTYLMAGFNVTETANKVGYINDAHYIKLFKKLIGITPKQYFLKQKSS